MKAPLGRHEIEQILPHREPFLLLDEVIAVEPGARVKVWLDGTPFETVRAPGYVVIRRAVSARRVRLVATDAAGNVRGPLVTRVGT